MPWLGLWLTEFHYIEVLLYRVPQKLNVHQLATTFGKSCAQTCQIWQYSLATSTCQVWQDSNLARFRVPKLARYGNIHQPPIIAKIVVIGQNWYQI